MRDERIMIVSDTAHSHGERSGPGLSGDMTRRPRRLIGLRNQMSRIGLPESSNENAVSTVSSRPTRARVAPNEDRLRGVLGVARMPSGRIRIIVFRYWMLARGNGIGWNGSEG